MLQANQGAPATSSTNATSATEIEPCIFKVHHELRNVNNKAYEPAMIAIGPYHRSVSHLQLMEAHKTRYQALLLKRMSNNEQLDTFTDAIRPDAEKARKCYSEPPDGGLKSPDQFLNMLVLDGMFIVELLLKFAQYESGRNLNDYFFKMPWALGLLQRDLILFENQIPFFILEKLYGMIPPPPGGNRLQFQDIAIAFFNDIFPGIGNNRRTPQGTEIKHFLDLFHMKWGTKEVVENGSCTIDTLKLMGCSSSTELWEAGVKFKKIGPFENSFKITFDNGELRIPVLDIEPRTESVLRNLIAYEQYSGDNRFHIVTDYMSFFTYLIKSEKDVARLTRHGIIDSLISDKVTTRMFSTIIEGVARTNENFQYAEIFERMHKHGRNRVNRYMASLWHDYANGPWDTISTLTVALILFLTILEVTFQILSWKKQK